MRRPPLVLVVVALQAALGCGGDDGEGGSAATTTDPGAGLDAEPVRERFAAGEPATGDPVARITVRSVAVDVLAFEGEGDVTHVVGSALPCVDDDLSVVLGASAFSTLAGMAAGDPIDVVVPVGRCRYEAGQVAVIDSADLARTRESVPDGAVLLLVTPGPEDGLSVVVVAARIGEVELDTTGTTSPSSTSTTSTVPVVQTPQPTGRAAVDAFLGAWQAGDRGAARAVADQVPVDLLFAVPVNRPSDRGCTQGDANQSVSCVYRLPTGELQVRAVPRQGGFIVDFVFHSGE
ncbi:MAG: hypothetical protein H0W25_12405 [Acidimicrobiia bacterium]|nr:hypothetical protein [Acidimicrobiia bacterium]